MELNCPVEWMQARLPADAIPVERELPPPHVEVLGWVSDPDVCIYYMPTVVRRDGTDDYWSGLPGQWLHLKNHRWHLSHWRHITPPIQPAKA